MTSLVGLRSDRKRPAATMGGNSSKQSYDLTSGTPQSEIPTPTPQTGGKDSAYVRNTELLPPPDPEAIVRSISRQSSSGSAPPASPVGTQPYVAPAQPYVAPAQPKVAPAQPKVAPAQPKVAPVQSNVAPAQPYVAPTPAPAASSTTPAGSTSQTVGTTSQTVGTTSQTVGTTSQTVGTTSQTVGTTSQTAGTGSYAAGSTQSAGSSYYSTVTTTTPAVSETKSVQQTTKTVREPSQVSSYSEYDDLYTQVNRTSTTTIIEKTAEPIKTNEPAVVAAVATSATNDTKIVTSASGMEKTFGTKVDSASDSDTEGDQEVEAEVCNVNDLKDGEMKEVDVGEGKALLVKDKGQFHAIGHKCSHYGAPLAKGAYCNGRVRCPWHGACFNVATGDIEDFPGLDSLQKFDVKVEGDKVKVKAKKSTLTTLKRVKHMSVAKEDEDSRTFLIIGSGGAGNACAETLRQEGFKGKVIMATKESSLPYDRPKLSKAMTSTAEALALRNKDFYDWSDITVLMNKEAEDLDAENKEVTFKNGEKIKFDKLFIATGGTPRTLPTPGADLENVCIMRTPADSNRIAALAKDKNVVIIGTSFIGVEMAAFAASKSSSVSVIGHSPEIFMYSLGPKLGAVIRKLHEEKGTKFYLGQSAKEFVGENGKLTEVVLQDDTRLPADLCVIGIGVYPTTEFLKSSGLDISERGFINVDKQMATNKADIFAGGDIVNFPLFINNNEHSNVQHWQMSHQHGRIAALNMVGKPTEIKSVPFFWTVQFGKSVRYTGFGLGYDDVVIHGDLDELKFIAYYTKGDKVIAVASLNYDPYVAKAAEFMTAGKVITKDEIINDPLGWEKRYSD